MKSERKSRTKQMSPYLLVILSFVGVIFFGSFLLSLPFAHTDGNWGNYMDALFHATSATCVTGLSTYTLGIGNELTLFGQIVMLVMIQIGGLGFITSFTFCNLQDIKCLPMILHFHFSITFVTQDKVGNRFHRFHFA